MKLAIVGSRSFNNYEVLKQNIDLRNITCIISGGARGADTLAERLAHDNGLDYIEFLPDWEKNGKSAGFLRNVDIIQNADMVVAFWDGSSKGTKHSISLAKKYGKPLKIVYIVPDVFEWIE